MVYIEKLTITVYGSFVIVLRRKVQFSNGLDTT